MSKITKGMFAAVLAVGMIGSVAGAATYEVDASHSYVGFSVRHMVVSNTKGSFGEVKGTIEFDQDAPESISASAIVSVQSVDTKNEKRDKHLRGSDFFDVEKYPEITFETTRVEGSLPEVTLIGNLTIKDVTKEVSIPAEFTGPVTDPWGNVRIGFSGSTKINRKDYGISFSKVMDGGGLVVGDEVKISLEIEGIKK